MESVKDKCTDFLKRYKLNRYLILVIIVFYVINRFCYIFSLGSTFPEKLNNLLTGKHFWGFISFKKDVLLISLFFTAGLIWLTYTKSKEARAKKYRKGKEYGTAAWANEEDAKVYKDPIESNNLILSDKIRLTLSGKAIKPYHPTTARNKNVLIIGGSGSGKTRFYVKPNLMQMHSDYVVTDPKGTLILETGKMFQRGYPVRDKKTKKIYYKPYDIKVFNTINFSKSMHYNPFAYINTEQDILSFCTTLIKNTSGKDEKADFWTKAENLLYVAYIAYLFATFEDSKLINIGNLIDMIEKSEVNEDDADAKNEIDLQFDELEKNLSNFGKFTERQKNFAELAIRSYEKYKLAAGKTAKSVLISCAARLQPFDITAVRNLLMFDELDLSGFGEKKKRSILYIVISDTDSTFNFLVSILYTQMFQILIKKADDVYHGKLPTHVRLILDEFANIGLIPDFEKLIATLRSREISANIILQAQSQLKAIYKDNAETIVGNCDSTIFLGGKEKTTLKELSEILGKETIDTITNSETRSNQKSYGLNYQKTGKELMTQDEIASMDGRKCIVQIRGTRPFLDSKYDLLKHVRYPLLADGKNEKENLFEYDKVLFSDCELVEEDKDEDNDLTNITLVKDEKLSEKIPKREEGEIENEQ